MNQPTRMSCEFSGSGGKTMSFETGKLAGLADGAVLAQLGETTVLVTATAAKKMRDGADFFPLTVDIEERMYAVGRIPGSFFRREARAGDAAILTCRLIDRPLRPAFPDGFRNEVHVVGTVMGADHVNPYDVLAINAASCALSLSGIPFSGPIGAVRIAYGTDGNWIVHPTYEEGDASTFEMVVAGRETEDGGDIAIMMVEAGGSEKAWEYYQDGAPKVTEAVLAEGLEAAKTPIAEAISAQRDLVRQAGQKPTMEYELASDYSDEVYAAVSEAGTEKLQAAEQIADKAERSAAEDAAAAEITEALADRFSDVGDAGSQITAAIRSLTKSIIRARIVNEGVRIDGRSTTQIRPLSAEVALIPTAHGTGLFQRGETQVLNFTTLGMKRMDQMIDGLDPVDRKRYMHHYNFPPFSTGETGFMRGPKRREIGHGLLAERALVPVVPPIEEFPYTLRLVSEVLSSNGSTSMASVCSSSLSLMDAGVPIKAPVAGIAMGLVFAEGKYTTLTDILGAEDAFGDMDFKVAGTSEFITALQLDTKIDGIPAEVLAQALDQARDAREEILGVMAGALSEPRADVGKTAPKIVSFEIPVDKIGEVIGPKGKVINTIQSETGADITVDDDGMVGIVEIASSDREVVEEAERQIRLILDPPTAEVGATYDGRVVNITKFGAFINILPGRDGLLHISKIGGRRRIDKVEDELALGDEIQVIVDDVDPNGKISLVPADSDGGSEPSAEDDAESRPERSRGRDRRDSRSEKRSRSSNDDSGSDDSGDDPLAGVRKVSFEDEFESEMRDEFGDLGPSKDSGSGGDRGDRRRRR